MGTVRYTVIDGEVIAEKRNGVRSLYVPDPLGSTVALLDNTQAQTDTFSYWPYGENDARTGATATPFQFGGTICYFKDSSTRIYVDERSLDTQTGRWLGYAPATQWENLNAYVFGSDPPIERPVGPGIRPTKEFPKGYRRRGNNIDPCNRFNGLFAPPTPEYETCKNPLALMLCELLCTGCHYDPNFDVIYDPDDDRGGVLRCCCKKGEPDTSPPGLNAHIRCYDQVDIDLSPSEKRRRSEELTVLRP